MDSVDNNTSLLDGISFCDANEVSSQRRMGKKKRDRKDSKKALKRSKRRQNRRAEGSKKMIEAVYSLEGEKMYQGQNSLQEEPVEMRSTRLIYAPTEDYKTDMDVALKENHVDDCDRKAEGRRAQEYIEADPNSINDSSNEKITGDRSQSQFESGATRSQSDLFRHESDGDEETDLNKIAACALRAQMRGDMDQFKLYKKQLDEREAELQISNASKGSAGKHCTSSPAGLQHTDSRHRTKEQSSRTGADSKSSLEDLVREERIGHAHDTIYRSAKPHLAGVEQLMPRSTEQAAQRIERALALSKTGGIQTERCWLCFQNPRFRNSDLLSVGRFTYLMLAHSSQRLAPQHCCIVPLHHLASFGAADDQTWKEVQLYQQSLRAFYRKWNKSVIFLEQASAPHQRRHTKMECIPVVPEIASSAPLYFRQELLQAAEEWATHSKILLIEGTAKNFRRVVPSRMPYFYVEWDIGKGYAHIIENESKFPRQFGLEVIKGMAEPSEQNVENERSTNDEFEGEAAYITLWSSFDWTRQLYE
uniref:Uncharacterized protein AlNc14C355G10948 n=1 Tax=Albugo laibachii Nc14 TaxID=890382 RepID=F0WXJ7_9STRA|nr:conserved hypothetical protein [Albugo laibachii Nc14]|eukprot:CCA26191.1 conserved hypothetical protein [Albugo laibachii Nc14]